jgi:REP element-mobilizing transposase RayT
MARPLRLEFPHAVYHVTSRGNARQRIVTADADRQAWLTVLSHVVGRFGWLCHAYCLMDNHYHLLMETPQPNLSRGMRQLNGVYTQVFNRRHGRVGHLFQGRFTAILVEKESHLLELCRYVVLNPVRAKAVTKPRDWLWSSYCATAGELAASAWLTVDWVLNQFGHGLRSAQAKYRDFVREGIGGPTPWEEVQGQIYLGSEAFIEQHQPDRVLAEIPRKQSQAKRPSLTDLFGQRGFHDQHIVTAYRRYGYRLKEIAGHLGVHYATASRRLARGEKEGGV